MSKPAQALPIRLHNGLKEFEELLLDNTLLKVQKSSFESNKNPKGKEWWEIVQAFTKEQIQENMELM